MHTIDDSQNNVTIHHNADWSGHINLIWDTGECRLDGEDLTAGKITLIVGRNPPVEVSHRAVALAVESYLRDIITTACDDMLIRRDMSDQGRRQRRRSGARK